MAASEGSEVAHDLRNAADSDEAYLNSSTDLSADKATGPDATRPSLSSAANLSLDDVAPVHVKIRNLSVSVDLVPSWLEPATYRGLLATRLGTPDAAACFSKTLLLHSVSADLPPGSLTAIVGGSGSGKTTLLNALAEKTSSSRWSQEGTTTFNGQLGVQNARHAYVMQQDILLPTLTVRETLQYSAALRLPPSTPACARLRVVEEVIAELGLKECAETRIGNSQHRGCSGGEKRRVSIGVQLLANPSVLFLDEPTTGLDASSAFQLVRVLTGLARKGRTVVMTVHQPRSEMWHLFDNLIVLSRGSPVYSGITSGCLPWFKAQGFDIPPFVNPAEYIVDTSAVDNRTKELEKESHARVTGLKAAWSSEAASRFAPVPATADAVAQGLNTEAVGRIGFFPQLRVLTSRTLKVTYRDPLGMWASIFEGVLMGLLSGCLFYNLGRDQSGIRSRQGGLYTAAGLQGYLVLVFEVYRMSIDITTFDREASDSCVNAVPFILSRRLARLATEDVPTPLIFSALFYFMAGFDRDAGKFFVFFAITLINHYIAVTCAMTCVVAVRHFAGASLMANMVFTLQTLACGIFVQSNTIPVYVRWLKWITYAYYAFGAYVGNEFRGNSYDCPDSGGPSSPACAHYTGEYVIESLGFPQDWVVPPIMAMLAFVVFFCIVSAVGLSVFKPGMAVTRARATDEGQPVGSEKMKTRSAQDARTVDLGMHRFALALDRRSAYGKRLPRKTILQPVDVTFQAGVLNVIMGPSGSGKTSLLDSVALRLRSSIGAQYRSSGSVTLNGSIPTDSVMHAICSYVCQEDDALLPSLTVRETLRFAAGLRLPAFMGTADKRRRADEVMMKMGLKDCADNLVGDDIVKGISGGEKRRVSIAIQILTDPRILLLDEPTSGLDAFTARYIMDVLRCLAEEGRTIILTIHQARSDLFRQFGNVLLLAQGGATAYAGPAKDMVEYFDSLGHECPQHTNPADFALDLVTVDLRQADREAQSRERVLSLVEAWKTHGLGPSEKDSGRSADAPDDSGPGEVEEKACSVDMTTAAHTIPESTSSPRPSTRRANLPAELGALVRTQATFCAALPLLLQRATINTRRQPRLVIARTTQVLGLAIVLALFLAPLHNDYFSVQSRTGFLQELGALYFIGMLQNVAIYPGERDVFYSEADDGVYGVGAFLASYTIIETPFEIVSSLFFGLFAVLVIGLPRTVTMYFVCVFACFGTVSCGESLGIMFNTLFGHTGFAVNVMGSILCVANVMAGIVSIDMPAPFQAVNYLSPIRYAIRAAAPYSLRGIDFTCTDAQRLPGGVCPIQKGEDVLELYKLNVDPVVSVAALAACVVIYRGLAIVLLGIARKRWRV